MNKILAGEDCPCGWRYYAAGEKHACPSEVDRSTPGCHPHTSMTVRTEFGTVTLKEWFLTFLGSVMNGGGHDLLLFLEDCGQLRCISVGVCEGVYAYEDVYGISPDWFRVPSREHE